MPKLIPFFTTLPKECIAEIGRRARKHDVAKWRVIDDAVTRDKTAEMHPKSFSEVRKMARQCRRNVSDYFTGGPRRKARGKRG